MQIKSLEYLLALERHRTINKAAAASYISQQGMSRVMDSMERELGVTLFVRSHSGIALTKEGAALCRYAQKIVPLFAEAVEELHETGAGDTPVLMSGRFVHGVFQNAYEHLPDRERYSFTQVSDDQRLARLREPGFRGILLDAWFDGGPDGEAMASDPSFTVETLLTSRVGVMTAAGSERASYSVEQARNMKLLSVDTPIYRSCAQSVFGKAGMDDTVIFVENAPLVQHSIAEDPGLAILTTKLSFFWNVPAQRRAALAFSPIEPARYFAAYAVHRADCDSQGVARALFDWRQAVRAALQQAGQRE